MQLSYTSTIRADTPIMQPESWIRTRTCISSTSRNITRKTASGNGTSGLRCLRTISITSVSIRVPWSLTRSRSSSPRFPIRRFKTKRSYAMTPHIIFFHHSPIITKNHDFLKSIVFLSFLKLFQDASAQLHSQNFIYECSEKFKFLSKSNTNIKNHK